MGLSGNPALQNKLYGLYPSNLQPKSSFLTDGLMLVINVESPRIFSVYNLNANCIHLGKKFDICLLLTTPPRPSPPLPSKYDWLDVEILHWRVQMTRHDQSVSEGEAGGMVAVRGHQMRDDRSGQRKSPHRCPTVLQRREATAHQDQNLG